MKIAVVIPCFKVKKHLKDLLAKIPREVTGIFIVDDACPESSGDWVLANIKDKRIRVQILPKNLGVGGAVKAGYKQALTEGFEIMVKLDGDGQMNPKHIAKIVAPILRGEADYVKGNRFFHPDFLEQMPKLRMIGNGILSFLNKLVSGYWDIMDPTNGYTAIHEQTLRLLPLDKIDNRYFFESDMLFRLNIARAVVQDVPMIALYADEESQLNIGKVACSFPIKYLNRLPKRIFYNYILRDFNMGSISLLFGFLLTTFGIVFGARAWILGEFKHEEASSGTVMLAALPIILGFQLLLFALQYDILSIPRKSIRKLFEQDSII
ncbi:MAG: glycosyltransferase [Leptospira sp.]|jgi:dolichol-phosphate mannosyltransferase|nr:glycosyltransferase [Leptospira sp.]